MQATLTLHQGVPSHMSLNIRKKDENLFILNAISGKGVRTKKDFVYWTMFSILDFKAVKHVKSHVSNRCNRKVKLLNKHNNLSSSKN